MRSLLLLPFLLTLYSNPLRAQTAWPGEGHLKAGPVEVHPFLGLSETYSDNIYQNYGGFPAAADFITTLNPGLHLVLPLRSHRLQAGYQARVYRYADNPETDYTAQRAEGRFSFDFPGGLNGNLSYTFLDDQIPRRATENPAVPETQDPYRAKPFQVNDFNARARYQFADLWAAETYYNLYDYDYKNPDDDYGTLRRNLFGATLYYRLVPRVKALVDYNFALVNYPFNEVNDNANQSAYLGLDFDATAKISGFFKIGWTQKKYDQNLPTRKNDVSTSSLLADLKYALSEADLFQLTAGRALKEDVDTYTTYTSNTLALTYRHPLAWNEKITLVSGLGFRTLQFDGATFDADGVLKIRDDRQWSLGVGFDYALQKWLSVELKYSHVTNNSNFINYNYVENRVWLNVLVAF